MTDAFASLISLRFSTGEYSYFYKIFHNNFMAMFVIILVHI